MREHMLMDWRLGMSILRLMADEQECLLSDRVGTLAEDCQNLDKDHEMSDLLTGMNEVQNKLKMSGGESIVKRTFGDLPGVIDEKTGRAYIIVHPLWRLPQDAGGQTAPVVIGALTEAVQSGYQSTQIGYVDTFNGHRRPGWCLSRL